MFFVIYGHVFDIDGDAARGLYELNRMRQDCQVADPKKVEFKQARIVLIDRVHVVLRDDLAALRVFLERSKFDKRIWRYHNACSVHPTWRAQPSIFLRGR
jgi:hypothetical protein